MFNVLFCFLYYDYGFMVTVTLFARCRKELKRGYRLLSPGRVARLARASSPVMRQGFGWFILGQGTYENQPMNAQISGTASPCFSVSLTNK